MLQRIVYILLFTLSASAVGFAQNAVLNTDGASPDPSAMFDIQSTERGLLIPRMTSAQRIAIPSPAVGLLVFDQTAKAFFLYDGTAWQEILKRSTDTDTDNQYMSQDGDLIRLQRGAKADLAKYVRALADTDGDTKIQVEKSADEDKIRLERAGAFMALADAIGFGLGTETPTQMLTIYDGNLNLRTSDNANHQSILFQNADGKYAWRIFAQDQGTGNNRSDLVFMGGLEENPQGLSPYLTIKNSGGIGINNPSPQHALSVFGDARFTGTLNSGAFLLLLSDGDSTDVYTGTGWQGGMYEKSTIADADGDTRIETPQLTGNDSIYFVLDNAIAFGLNQRNATNGRAAFSFKNNQENLIFGNHLPLHLFTASDQANVIMGDSILGNLTSRIVAGFNHSVIMGTKAAAYSRSNVGDVIMGNNAGADVNKTDSNVLIGNNVLGDHFATGSTEASSQTRVFNNFGNVLVGYKAAGKAYDIEDKNIMVGAEAGYNNGAMRNIMIGYRSGYSNGSDGYNNVFLGDSTGFYNAYNISAGSSTVADDNLFAGSKAGFNNTGGASNNFLGSRAGFTNTTGSYNDFLGAYAGEDITTGSYNAGLGFKAGSGAAGSSSYNVYLGSSAGATSQADSCIYIGTNAGYGNAASQRLFIDQSTANATEASTPLIYGEFDTNLVRINGNLQYTGTISSFSDRRLKEDFLPIDGALSKISKLNGFSYHMKDDPKKQREFGVIAQELQEVFPEMVEIFDQENGYLAAEYLQLVPVLLEAIKERQQLIEKRQQQIEQQKAALEALQSLKAEVETVKALLGEE